MACTDEKDRSVSGLASIRGWGPIIAKANCTKGRHECSFDPGGSSQPVWVVPRTEFTGGNPGWAGITKRRQSLLARAVITGASANLAIECDQKPIQGYPERQRRPPWSSPWTGQQYVCLSGHLFLVCGS